MSSVAWREAQVVFAQGPAKGDRKAQRSRLRAGFHPQYSSSFERIAPLLPLSGKDTFWWLTEGRAELRATKERQLAESLHLPPPLAPAPQQVLHSFDCPDADIDLDFLLEAEGWP